MSPLFRRKKRDPQDPLDRVADEFERRGQGEEWWRVCMQTASQYLEQNRFDDAIDRFTQAIKARPDDPDAYVGRSAAHSKKGNLSQAVADMSRAIDLGAATVQAYQARAMLHWRRKDWHALIADATRMIQLDPQNAWAYRARYKARAAVDDWDRSQQDLEAWARLEPGRATKEIEAMYQSGQVDLSP